MKSILDHYIYQELQGIDICEAVKVINTSDFYISVNDSCGCDTKLDIAKLIK